MRKDGAPPEPERGELLVERKIIGSAQKVSVIDPKTGREASATGPIAPGVEHRLLEIAIAKLRRGISV